MKLNLLKLFFKRLFKRKSPFLTIGDDLKVKQREPKENELALGWAWGHEEGTSQEVSQLKGIDDKYRSAHFYIIGGSGTGKTKFLESLIQQDIKKGNGFGIIDPHGDLIEDVKGWLYLSNQNKDFLENVVLIDPTDPDFTVSFNPLEKIEGIPAAEQAKELLEVFKKIWWDSWGARMEDILRNSFIVLVENELTLLELPLLLSDAVFRKRILKNVKNETCIQRFNEFDNLNPKTRREWMESTLNKVNAFLSDERIRQIFSSQKSTFNLREIMDNRKILLVKLDKGRLKESASLLGSLLLSKIQMAAFSRTDIPQSQRVPFYLYIDEFQNFATRSFIDTLSEARKYKLSLVLAHQNLSQLPKELKDSILANCGIQACFRVSREDAQVLAKELLSALYSRPPGWEVNIQSLQSISPRECFIKNKIEGGVVFLTTPTVVSPWKDFEGESEASFKEKIDNSGTGKEYLRNRSEIESLYRDRLKYLTKSIEPDDFRESK